MKLEEQFDQICTNSLMLDEKIQQQPYYYQGSFVCKQCAQTCRQNQNFELKKVYYFKFKCQCSLLEGGCYLQIQKNEEFRKQHNLDENMNEIKNIQKNFVLKKLEDLSTREIPINILAQQKFENSIESDLENAYLYKEEMTQMMALSVVPLEIQNISDQIEQLKALLNWFKKDFFTWCNKPKCPKCNSEANMERHGDETPNSEDREWNASRIESYRCTIHQIIQRFPRYNNPIKLFQTRTGRCGEWANAFTSICIALGHDARKVHDWTDHVWTEVYIDSFQRWVHLDSCEPLFDQPLTYEKGWGKQLNYIIATSAYEIVDVSRRYVLDPFMNKMRRDKVNEKWLADYIQSKRECLWEMQGPDIAQYYRFRFEQEQQELLQCNSKNDYNQEEFLPRQSGSLEWRQERGEMGQKKEEFCIKKENIQKPKKSVEELKEDQIVKKELIKILVTQIEKGCGKEGCQNIKFCLTANTNLQQDLKIIHTNDKSQFVLSALKIQKENEDQKIYICK